MNIDKTVHGKFIFLCMVFLLLNGCMRLVGIKPYRVLSDAEIEKNITKYKIPNTYAFKIDTLAYKKMVGQIKMSHPKLFKDLQQPLQVKAFNTKGEMSLFLINCNIGGFPNLKWNRFGTFDTFPPRPGYFKKVDTTFSFSEDLNFYQQINNEKITPASIENGDMYFVIFWARFVSKQSKKLIEQIKRYQKQFPDKKIITIFVNTDNLYNESTRIN